MPSCHRTGGLHLCVGLGKAAGPKGAELVEIMNGSSNALEDVPAGTAPVRSVVDGANESEEKHLEPFEAIVVRLDQAAAEQLVRLADV
jgi:hypothetical protein